MNAAPPPASERFAARAQQSNPEHIVIVGSGATATMAASELLAAGIPVTMLAIGPHKLGAEASAWPLVAVEEGTDTPPSEFMWCRAHQVGGRMTKWSRMSLRYAKTELVGEAQLAPELVWPIGYDELEPHYARAEALLDIVGGREASPLVPPGVLRRAQPDEAYFATRFRERIGARRMAVIRPRLAQLDASRYVAEVLGADPKFAIRAGAEVLRIEMDPHDASPTAVVYRDESGHEASVRTRHVLLGASAIASAKILLSSATPRWPRGLGNEHGNVGRYLNDHALLKCRLRTRLPDAPASVVQGAVLVGAEQLLDRPLFGGFGKIQVQLGGTRLDGDEWDLSVNAFGSTPPTAQSALTLGSLDPAGGRRLRFDYHRIDDHRAMLDAMRALVESLFPAAPLFDLATNVPGDAVHDLGTCRMGADPRTSVVDRDGLVHGLAGLRVIDGGVMPYQSAKNPTLTLMAIASRSAHELVRALR